MPPPPISTLFPYTTLFRSRFPRTTKSDVAVRNSSQNSSFSDPVRTWCSDKRDVTFASAVSGEDRKSTRLNSSHANISYAVFCLKKKTHRRPDEPGQAR